MVPAGLVERFRPSLPSKIFPGYMKHSSSNKVMNKTLSYSNSFALGSGSLPTCLIARCLKKPAEPHHRFHLQTAKYRWWIILMKSYLDCPEWLDPLWQIDAAAFSHACWALNDSWINMLLLLIHFRFTFQTLSTSTSTSSLHSAISCACPTGWWCF